jgi:hypothetical protein
MPTGTREAGGGRALAARAVRFAKPGAEAYTGSLHPANLC